MQLWSRRKLGVGDEDELWELRRETGVGRSKRRFHKEFIPRACVSKDKTSPTGGDKYMCAHISMGQALCWDGL